MIEFVKICMFLVSPITLSNTPCEKIEKYSYTIDFMEQERKQNFKKNHLIKLPTEWARIEKKPVKASN